MTKDLNGKPKDTISSGLTVEQVHNLSRAKLVHNLSIESRPGEVTHNYLVGEHGIWVHNIIQKIRKKLGKWKRILPVIIPLLGDPNPADIRQTDFTDVETSCKPRPFRNKKRRPKLGTDPDKRRPVDE